ncbi:RagB/SusD family nutrient uptake outer membrane protein [Maribellus maritimus]|uniref:RagB/SusD family nutrient uptake outer membrane protein n=1 Tax=Maribellus maritimus TaxID=2870838 RepID=UPI001EEC2310|nr:RagB/SusD family nutrient uptake outer membrane protein [Maribellus maritimus]MCG6188385.1 RagB/SusD family nutrient uptake outer membrane protein [Maribellus maritimus]
MKTNIIKYTLFAFLFVVISCDDDYLDRSPLSEVSSDVFFQKASDLELYTNAFYFMFPEISIYDGDANSDNIILYSPSDLVRGSRVVPTSAGDAGWNWDDLRDINFFLANYEKCIDESARKHYSGVAKFFRAYFYFEKVKRFGDVPWYEGVIEPDDEEALQKARDSRTLVMDNVLTDIDYAITNMNNNTSVYTVTKWTALALKSRIGLFEGTFRKYHGIEGYEKFLNACVNASEELMNSGTYNIYSTGNPEVDYRDLFTAHDAIGEEIILARQFSGEQSIDHNVNYYTITSSYGMPGMPKDLVNSYLMTDGSRFTDKADYNKIEFTEEVKSRDLRLTQTIRTPGYTRLGTSQTLPPDLAATITGYQLIKYVNETVYDSYDTGINDLPLFRFAEVLLNYAEAKAELGTLTQNDLDISVNKLRDRVNMPHMSLAEANANPDNFLAAQYVNVGGSNKGIVLEIRRERRIELFMENFRWYDLMRWKEGQKIVQDFRGMYFPGPGSYDLENDGDIDVVIYTEEPASKPEGTLFLKLGEDIVLDENNLINPQPEINDRKFDESKDYLYPLPITELLLNSNLTQNPNWE